MHSASLAALSFATVLLAACTTYSTESSLGTTASPPPKRADHMQARAAGVEFYVNRQGECFVPKSYYEQLQAQGWKRQYECRTVVGEPYTVACWVEDCNNLP